MNSKIILSLICLILLGTILRLDDWGQWAANPDEGVYWEAAFSSDLASLSKTIRSHTHPPLYYVLLWGIGQMSTDILILRVPALVSAVLLLFMTFIWLKRHLGERGALISVGILALSPELVVQSSLIRPYPFLLLIMVTALWLQDKYLELGNRSHSIGSGIFWMIALLTHYGAGLVLLITGLAHFFSRGQERKRRIHLVKFQVVAGLIGVRVAYHLLDRGVFDMASGFYVPSDWMGRFYADSFFSFVRLWDLQLDRMFGFELIEGLHELLILTGIIVMWKDHKFFALLAAGCFILASILSIVQLYPLGSGRHGLWLILILLPCLAASVKYLFMKESIIPKVLGSICLVMLVVGGLKPDSSLHGERVATRENVAHVVGWIKKSPSNRMFVTDFITVCMLAPAMDAAPRIDPGPDGFLLFSPRNVNFYVLPKWKSDLKDMNLKNPGKLGKDVWFVRGGWGREGQVNVVGVANFGATKLD